MADVPATSITIHDLDNTTWAGLRTRATLHNRSPEDEAHAILHSVLRQESAHPGDLAALIRARFSRLGGVELELPPRQPMRKLPFHDP